MDIRAPEQLYNPYRIFSREQWARLRDDTPMTLEPGEFSRLRSMHDRLDMKEVEDIYLPLSRLLSIYVDATQRLFYAQRQFRSVDADDVGHLAVLDAEELTLRVKQPLRGIDIDRQQSRQRQVNVLDLFHVETIMHRTQARELARLQRHRRIVTQPRPLLS